MRHDDGCAGRLPAPLTSVFQRVGLRDGRDVPQWDACQSYIIAKRKLKEEGCIRYEQAAYRPGAQEKPVGGCAKSLPPRSPFLADGRALTRHSVSYELASRS